MPGALAPDAVALLEDQAPQPRREGVGAVHPRQVQTSFEVGGLHRVLGQVPVSQQRPGIASGHALEPLEQLSGGGQVAGLRVIEQRLDLVHASVVSVSGGLPGGAGDRTPGFTPKIPGFAGGGERMSRFEHAETRNWGATSEGGPTAGRHPPCLFGLDLVHMLPP